LLGACAAANRNYGYACDEKAEACPHRTSCVVTGASKFLSTDLVLSDVVIATVGCPVLHREEQVVTGNDE
jgi:hypothetical protein